MCVAIALLHCPDEVTLPFVSRHSFSIFRTEYADANEHATKPRPIAPMGCLPLLTCYVWLPCVLAASKLTAFYTMKPPITRGGACFY